MSKDKFVGHERNKESFFAYLCELISEYFETTVANDDSDTLIANKAIDFSAASSVELMAEDCDVLVLLKHHGARSAGIYSSQRQREAFASQISLLTPKVMIHDPGPSLLTACFFTAELLIESGRAAAGCSRKPYKHCFDNFRNGLN